MSGGRKQITIKRTGQVSTRENVGPLVLQKMTGWLRLIVDHGPHPGDGRHRKSRVVLGRNEALELGRALIDFAERL